MACEWSTAHPGCMTPMNELGTTKQEARWAPEPVQTVLGKRKSLALAQIWTPDHPAPSQVTTPATLLDTECAKTYYLHTPAFNSICGHPAPKQLWLKGQIKYHWKWGVLKHSASVFLVKQLDILAIPTPRLGFKTRTLQTQSSYLGDSKLSFLFPLNWLHLRLMSLMAAYLGDMF